MGTVETESATPFTEEEQKYLKEQGYQVFNTTASRYYESRDVTIEKRIHPTLPYYVGLGDDNTIGPDGEKGWGREWSGCATFKEVKEKI